jgi:hypothetical protein
MVVSLNNGANPIFHRLRARGLKTLEHCLNYPIRAEAFETQLLLAGVGVEKVRDRNVFWATIIAVIEFSLFYLRGSFDSGCCRLAEEAHQSLDVLSRCSKPELLPHELQSAQAQATEPDLILEFREQRFHLLSLSLRLRELGRLRHHYTQNPCSGHDE